MSKKAKRARERETANLAKESVEVKGHGTGAARSGAAVQGRRGYLDVLWAAWRVAARGQLPLWVDKAASTALSYVHALACSRHGAADFLGDGGGARP